jgi:hypothetical protein
VDGKCAVNPLLNQAPYIKVRNTNETRDS